MKIILLFTIMLPVIAGVSLRLSDIDNRKQVHNFALVILALNLVLTLIINFFGYGQNCTILNIAMGLNISFKADWLAVFASTIFAVVWLLVGIYNREYLKYEGNEKNFTCYYLMSMGAVTGVVYAANPFTFYTFFELMSLTSFVLVLNSRTKESIAAAKRYIYYSIFGALCGLAAIMAFYGSNLIKVKEFIPGGSLVHELGGRMPVVAVIVFIAILGFSCKAGLFPMHSWLPVAYPEAPASASAVLSGVIAKTGIIAIIRIVYFVVGADVIRGTWVQFVFLVLATITIFTGSMMAYKEKLLKRRLAYSSVSQVSYALFGVMTLSTMGLIGALLQIVFHALAKVALFLVSGMVISQSGKKYVDQITGLGHAMPATFAFLTIAGLSLAGVPFTGGFISKYFLVQSALAGNFGTVEFIGFIIVMVSALLTGGYMLSISAKALFAHKDMVVAEKCEAPLTMVVPVGIVTALIIILGVCPNFVVDMITNVVATLAI